MYMIPSCPHNFKMVAPRTTKFGYPKSKYDQNN